MFETTKKISPLAEKPCVPCREGGSRVQGEDLSRLVAELGGEWEAAQDTRLEKEFQFNNFRTALDFADQVGALAEQINHHPDLTVSWGRTKVVIWTHKIGGLSETDFIFAAKTDALYLKAKETAPAD